MMTFVLALVPLQIVMQGTNILSILAEMVSWAFDHLRYCYFVMLFRLQADGCGYGL